MRQRSITALASLVVATSIAGCGEDHEHGHDEDLFEEFCEHLSEGPSQDIAAALDASGTLGELALSHTDLRLMRPVGGTGATTLFAQFSAPQDGTYVFVLSEDAPLKLTSVASGADVSFATDAEGPADCAAIGVTYRGTLSAGTYVVAVGPVDASMVSFLFELEE